MPITNSRLLNSSFILSHEGVCGASAFVSLALSAPLDTVYPQGRMVVFITQTTTVVPLHIEPRVLFTDLLGTETFVPLAVDVVSNTQPFGGSAHQTRNLVLLLSGQNAAIPLVGVAGSALRIVVMAASNPASAAVVSGSIAVFAL